MRARNQIRSGLQAGIQSGLLGLMFAFPLLATIMVRAQVVDSRSPSIDTSNNGATSGGNVPTSFQVRFMEFENVYLSLPPGASLAKGMKLQVRRSSGNGNSAEESIAELTVTSVSPTSAICEVLKMRDAIQRGDRAYVLNELAAHVSRSPMSAQKTPVAPTITPAKQIPANTHSASAQPPIAVAVVRPANAAVSPNQPPNPRIAVTQVTTPVSAQIDLPVASQQQPAVGAPVTSPTNSPVATQKAVAVAAAIPPKPQTQDVIRARASEVKDSASPATASSIAANTPPAKEHEIETASLTSIPSSDASIPTPSVSAMPTVFKVKFVAQDTVYISAGSGTGLTAGMKLNVKHSEPDVTAEGTLARANQAPTIAELEVLSVASASAVCDIKSKTQDIQQGDLAFMDQTTAQTLAEKQALSATRKYPQVVSFSDGDPLDEEVREEVPRPPLPEVNRMRGRIGFDYSDITSTGSVASSSSEIGMVARADFTRIGGSYWNLSGYWRGRLDNSSSAEQPTLQDLINRTYHLDLTYSNPSSPWVAGFGRMFLPWASSLNTLDGGYIGRRAGKHVIVGTFAGSTPDPTSWDYNPDRRIAGVFMNVEGGSFESFHYTTTSGVALSTLLWQVDRPFIFFENGLNYKRFLSIYDSTQADSPRPIAGLNAVGPGLSQNFLTVRLQPIERLSFDVNDNYFRDVPTFSTALIATGLLDQYLFQGLSAGGRIEPIRHITFYTSIGKSSRTGDTNSSWNEMYGITLAQLWRTGLRVDTRYSKFDSSFGNGNYRSLSISRSVNDALRLDVQFGLQNLTSQFTTQTNSRFVNATVDGNLGRNYFLQGAFTVNRGGDFNYNQMTVTFGYRFDNRTPGVSK
jgi:hypothetical protein